VEEKQSANITSINIAEEAGFEQVFKAHFKALHAYAAIMLRDEVAGEEVVQNMFLKLWVKRNEMQFDTSLKAYLYKWVHNLCLNHIKHEKVRSAHRDYVAYTSRVESGNPDENLVHSQLKEKLQEALNELPEGCRTIFQMSRFEELKYREIAEQLDVSIKTVENQMGKALKLLRLKLVDFLPLILILLKTLSFWFKK
jgi:RNA polymerase sigma-70 factor (ECF subfamily)